MAEIAGLVLGAIPLLISALEHHEKLVKPAVAFVRWRGQLPNSTRRLWMGHTAYEQNVRLLLMQAMSSEDIDRIMGDPQSDDWKDEWLVTELQEKLGNAYQATMSTIREIADIMVSVATALNIEGADKVRRSPPSLFTAGRNQTPELTQTVDHSARPGSDCPRQSPGSNRGRLEQVRLPEARRFHSETAISGGEIETARRMQSETRQLSREGRETS
jgi:hypothetical protein